MPVTGRRQPEVLQPGIFAEHDEIVAGFSTRRGGASSAPYDSLNLGYSSGDDRALVTENRRRLFARFGIGLDQLAVAFQVHGADVVTAEAPGAYPGHDALVTSRPDVCLCIVAADCASVLFADPEAGVIGAAHAGWRGTVAGVIPNTVAAMRALGAEADRLLCYLSPCISASHFEVGLEVAARFKPAFVSPAEDTGAKAYVDLPGAIKDQLLAEGIAPGHLEVSEECTFADVSKFFSHRAEMGLTGRMMGFIMRRRSR